MLSMFVIKFELQCTTYFLNSHLAKCGMVILKIEEAMERRTTAYTAVIMDRLDAETLCICRLSGVMPRKMRTS